MQNNCSKIRNKERERRRGRERQSRDEKEINQHENILERDKNQRHESSDSLDCIRQTFESENEGTNSSERTKKK